MAKRKPISPAEMEALNVLWEHGSRSYREVHEILTARGKTWAATTVQTLLQRLQAKGFVERTLQSGTSFFRAVESRDSFVRHSLESLSEDISAGPMPVVLNLIKGSKFTPEQIEQLQALLGEMQADSEGQVAKKRGRKGS